MAVPITSRVPRAPPPNLNLRPIFTTVHIILAFLALLALLALLGIMCFFTLLAHDLFYIPYLSEFSKFLGIVLSPFLPLFFPFFLGVFLKVCQHKPWPRKKLWVFVTASWVFSGLQRAIIDAIALYHGGEVCGLSECKGKWVEWLLVAVVVACQVGGGKWDAGLVDWCLDGVIEHEAVLETYNRIANGEMPPRLDLEKADDSESESYSDEDEEEDEDKDETELKAKG